MNRYPRRSHCEVLGGFAAILGGAWFAAGCSTSPAPPPPVTVDCAVESAYDIHVVEDYESGGNSIQAAWFSYGDYTAGARHTGAVSGVTFGQMPTVPIEGNGHCGSKRALVLATEGHNDYGSGFGAYCFGNNYGVVQGDAGMLYPCNPQSAIGYEGFAFWARDPALPLSAMPGQVLTHVLIDASPPGGSGPPEAGFTLYHDGQEAGVPYEAVETFGTPQGPFTPAYTTKGVTVYFDDALTTQTALNFNNVANQVHSDQLIPDTCMQAPPSMGSCVTTQDPNTGTTTMTGAGCVPVPGQCGNSYTRTLTLTDDWRLYLLPFSSFLQDALPNRHDGPMDLAHIFTFGVRFPKESVAEVWISKLGFYRKKASDGGRD